MTDETLRQCAVMLGKKGGQSKSPAKVAASRANGQKNRKRKTALETATMPAPEVAVLFKPVLFRGSRER